MILGIGTDIVDIDRLRRIHGRFGEKLLSKILTSQEREYCLSHVDPYPHIGGRFAVKESVIKAVTSCLDKRLSMSDIEIFNWESGKPEVRFHNDALKVFSKINANIMVSIAHTGKYATATAILETTK